MRTQFPPQVSKSPIQIASPSNTTDQLKNNANKKVQVKAFKLKYLYRPSHILRKIIQSLQPALCFTNTIARCELKFKNRHIRLIYFRKGLL